VAPVGSSEPEFVPPGPGRLGYQHWAAYNFHTNFASAVYYRDTPDRLTMPRYETDSETDMAIEFMRSRTAAKKPFFAMVAPHPPHPPWRANQVPAGCLDRVAPQLSWRPNVKARLDSSNKDPRCYYAMISNVDDNIGRLMSFLDESGAAANTIVVLTSDHGEMLASHGRYNKMVPYAEAVNIPLIVRWPGRVRAGSNSDALFTPMDHFPTLVRLCGLETPDIVDGMDLSPQDLGRRGPERDAALMMNFVSHWDYPETGSDWPEWRGLRTKQYTYARWLNGPEEFYDNAADPYQMRNLFDGRNAPVAMQHLRGRLRDLLRESHDEIPPGTAYGEWLTPQRNFVRNGLGPIRT
jgi:arylsulfatase A-like enzyme